MAADLLRPVPPLVSYLAADLGRAGHAMIFRFLPPLAVGVLFFDLYAPSRWFAVPLSALSIVLAVVASLGLRFLVNATAYWLHDARGPITLWTLSAGVLAGLYFPLRFLPDWLAVTLWVGTPFPGLLQTPLDVLVERDPAPVQVGLVGVQAVWAAALVVDVDTPLPPGFSVPGAELVALEADGHRASFDLLSSSAGAVVAELASLASLRDLSLVEPDIEDVVAQLYRS